MEKGRGRPKLLRQVGLDLEADYFKPAGVRMVDLESVEVSMEEAEVIRLIDLEGLSQEGAAGEMGISRGTLWRELQDARRKIADALINGKAIQIKGGNYELKEKMAGRGRQGGFGLGPGGDCVCPECGHKTAHARGQPCYQKTCPKCGAKMTRS